MKKSLALVLALIMVLSSFSFVSAAPDFSDVAGTKYEDAVTRLELLNVLKGYPDGTFKPEGSITRAEFAAVAVRVKGLAAVAEASKGLPSGFSDVPAGHWAAGYVGVAGSTGIVKGIGGGLFAPNAPVKYEEAVTMLVRALGYEQDALSKGGYPFGYLIVAKEIDLLDSVAGVMGMPATRGMVAMLTDNALEIPMMVQVGFGSDAKWVVSGTREHGGDEMYLLDSMGFDTFEGRVTSYSTSRDTITLKGKDSITLDVADDFDYYEVNGVTIKVWAKDDMVIVYTLKDDVKFDAAEWDADEEEILLVTEDEYYEVADDAAFLLNGSKVAADKFEAEFAKVVLNDDNEIVWAEGFTVEFIVVEEVKSEIAYAYDDYDEVDLEDFTVVKDGKTIEIADIAEGDVVFYNVANEFAVVFNSSVEGDITRVYDGAIDSFRLDGTLYTLAISAVYLDGSDMDLVDASILEDIMDEDPAVEIFLNFEGDVVLVVGDTGTAATDDFYAYVTATPAKFQLRTKYYYSLDVITEDGEEVNFDVEIKSEDYAEWTTDIAKGNVLKITVEEDGDFKTYEKFATTKVGDVTKLETDETYAGSFRLQDTAIVFWTEDFTTDVDDIEVMTWKEAADKFSWVTGTVYANSSSRVVVIDVTDSDADEDNDKMTGMISAVKVIGTDKWEISLKTGGTTKRIDTDKDYIKSADITAIDKGWFYEVEVDKTSGLIEKITKMTHTDEITITAIDYSGLKINGKYIMVPGYEVFEADNDFTTFRSLKVGDKVTMALDKAGTDFVKYVKLSPVGPVIVTPTPDTDKAEDALIAAYRLDGKVYIQVVEVITEVNKIVTYEYIGVQDVTTLATMVNQLVDVQFVTVGGVVYAQVVTVQP